MMFCSDKLCDYNQLVIIIIILVMCDASSMCMYNSDTHSCIYTITHVSICMHVSEGGREGETEITSHYRVSFRGGAGGAFAPPLGIWLPKNIFNVNS